MKINKNNYEAYLLDYLEGTISSQDKEALLLFFELHPQLKTELDTDIKLSLHSQEQLTISFKKQLLKHDADVYELPVSDYLLIKKQEEGLSKREEAELLLAEPDRQKRETISADYQQTILKPDTSITLTDKSKLRRFVLLPTVRQFIIRRGMAAAAIIALLGSVWLISETSTTEQPHMASTSQSKTEHPQQPIIAQSKILEKSLPSEKQPSKDSLLKLAKDPMELNGKTVTTEQTKQQQKVQYLASAGHVKPLDKHTINAYEHGLNVMMPQYMNNNLLKQELASIYRKLEDEENTPSLSLALVESGVKVMNFLSKESIKMQKYYNDNGDVVAYKVKGNNLELNKKIK